MILAVCVVGWALAAGLGLVALQMRRRLELAAYACHELRGPATALGLAVAALGREPGGAGHALALEAQLDRLRAGLDDLDAARTGRRAESRPATVGLERLVRGAAEGWRPAANARGRGLRVRSELGSALARADRGRLAQALGNLLSNAIEHGSGTVELLGRRRGRHVVIEVRDEGPAPSRPEGDGRGLAIAAAAVDDVGGRLTIGRRGGATVAAVELPAEDP